MYLICFYQISPAAVEVGDRNVVVLVKHTEQKVDTLKRGTDAHESNFNVYALRTCGMDGLEYVPESVSIKLV